MYGTGIGTLYGYVKVGQTYSRLFEEDGNKGKTDKILVSFFCLLLNFLTTFVRTKGKIPRNSLAFLSFAQYCTVP